MPLFRKQASGWAPPKTRSPKRSTGKNRKTIAWFAILVGVFTIIVNVEGAKAARGKTTDVVFAVANIPAGALITASDVALEPLSGLAHGYLSTASVIGDTAIHGLVPGEPITPGLVAKNATRNGLAAGQVGFWIPVSLITSGLVHAGADVDVLMVANSSSSHTLGIPVGQVLVSDVQVIAEANSNGGIIGSTTAPSNSLTNSATAGVPAAVELAVSPSQALQLLGAESSGTLNLVQAPWGQGTASNANNATTYTPPYNPPTTTSAPTSQPSTVPTTSAPTTAPSTKAKSSSATSGGGSVPGHIAYPFPVGGTSSAHTSSPATKSASHTTSGHLLRTHHKSS